MRGGIINSVILAIGVLATQVTASEFRVSLAEKVRISDFVAIIKILSVEKGRFPVPAGELLEYPEFNVKLTASITERIKGVSPDRIEIYAYSIPATAGFWEYGIDPGESYIAYLKATENTGFRLGKSSNQFLEVISEDGLSVNDIGQTLDQVPLVPKMRKLRALAAGGLPLALITNPIIIIITLTLVLLIGGAIICKKRFKMPKLS